MVKTSNNLEFDLEYIFKIINKQNPDKIGLQFPEGLKRQSFNIASLIEDHTGKDVIISGDPCFGACDIDYYLLSTVDIMFHFGHSTMNIEDNSTVYFIECQSNIDLTNVVKKAIPELKGKKIGIITTVQHTGKIQSAVKILESHGFEVILGTGDSRIKYPGQVLGCNFSVTDSSQCDEYLYVGSGNFHPIGVYLSKGKRVIIADPFMDEIRIVDPFKTMKQRYIVIAKCHDAIDFGIIVSKKAGQKRINLATKLKKLAKNHNKNAYIIYMDLITPEQLLNFKVDAFINTACPRIAIDDVGNYQSPMLTPIEFEILLGERNWDDLALDEIRGD